MTYNEKALSQHKILIPGERNVIFSYIPKGLQGSIGEIKKFIEDSIEGYELKNCTKFYFVYNESGCLYSSNKEMGVEEVIEYMFSETQPFPLAFKFCFREENYLFFMEI